MLSGISQTQKDNHTLLLISLKTLLKIKKSKCKEARFIEPESRMVVARGLEVQGACQLALVVKNPPAKET